MSIVFDEDQEELRKTVRRFCEHRSPETEVRRLMDTAAGYDPDVWAQMAKQLGLAGLTIPEQYGGSGFGQLELTIVLEELGRSLLCAPYLSTVGLAVNLLLVSGDDDACASFLPQIASGDLIATVGWLEDPGTWAVDDVATTASPAADGWVLAGHKTFVTDGCLADLVLVAARVEGELALFAIEGDAPGLTRTPLPTIDQTRRFAQLEFASVPARLIKTPTGARTVLAKAMDLASVALAAEQVGGAQRLLDMSVEYARLRVQFGRPIGTFQAIKHKCADLLLDVESARSAAYHTAAAVTTDDPDLPVFARVAQATASDAFVRAAVDTIQIHGGVGFTWEHPAHLYFKRARSSEHLLGDATFHREQLTQRLGM